MKKINKLGDGIIVEDPDGNLRYSKGLIKNNETLLGGWFKAQPDGFLVLLLGGDNICPEVMALGN